MMGETINIMTLGGLALAIGILVDNGIVAIENINWHLEHGKDLEPAILDGAEQITVPAFVSTICICIVFVPMFFLTGVGRYLFVPMAEAVVFAMLASFLPVANAGADNGEVPAARARGGPARAAPGQPRIRSCGCRRGSTAASRALRDGYRRAARGRRRAAPAPSRWRSSPRCLASLGLLPWVGQDFFPSVDTGQFKLHLRAPTGTRIEETAILCDRVEATVRAGHSGQGTGQHHRQHRPAVFAASTSPTRTRRRSAPPTPTSSCRSARAIGRPPSCVRELRLRLAREYPGVLFSFMPADIVSQILNFGLPAPIDIQVVGRTLEANRQFAGALVRRLSQVPGIADLRVHQAFNQPQLHLDADRTRAAQAGFTQREVATNLLISLSGSGQTTPTFWLNPRDRRQLPGRHDDAAVPDGLASTGSARFRSPGASGARPQLLAGADARRPAGRAWRWSRTTTCSRSSTCSAPCRGATSAAWPGTSRRFSRTWRRTCRAARSSSCAGRSRP